MTEHSTVHVDLGASSYDILVGTGNLAGLAGFVAARRRISRVVIITDEHVEALYASPAAKSFADANIPAEVATVPAGETSKSVKVAEELWQKLLHGGADRQTLVVAVGGGVVGDLAGFVAATYARGLAFVQVPTTLLAQVDSSVGGKVGINLPGAKNIVGAFWQPLGVLIDTSVLATLPDREYRAGLAEVVKYGMILDADLFAYLENNVAQINARQQQVLEHIIVRCCRLKADVVEDDERELTGGRAMLNYGHTFAHAFESVSGYGSLLHGEAVSIGMGCAARLSNRLGRIDSTVVSRQDHLLAALGLPTKVPVLDVEELLKSMSHDKKVQHGRLRFVVANRIGEVELIEEVSSQEVRAALVND